MPRRPFAGAYSIRAQSSFGHAPSGFNSRPVLQPNQIQFAAEPDSTQIPPRLPRVQPGFPPGPPRTQFKLTCRAQFAVRPQIPFPARPNRARLKFKTEESQARLLIGTGPTQTQVRLRADPTHVKFRPSPDSTQETSDSAPAHLGFSSGSSQDP